MKLLKILGVVVVLAGACLWVTASGRFDSDLLAQGRPFDSAQGRLFESGPKRQLTILDGRGGRIGVSARDLDAAEADRQKVQGGVMIDEVQPDSPAEKA